MRYWVLPNIDQWRPYIATELSQALDAQVSLGSVKAQWDGIDPSFQLTDVDLTNRQGRKLLHLPELRAELSWRSIFTGMLQFGLIEANGMDVPVRRDSNRRVGKEWGSTCRSRWSR